MTHELDKAFKMMVLMLEPRIGENLAITIDNLAIGSGLSDQHLDPERGPVLNPKRRAAEHLLETRFGDFPWLVISSSKGYFRPETVDELNHWWASHQSRILANSIRMKTGRLKAPVSGFRYIGGGRFEKIIPHKTDLFA